MASLLKSELELSWTGDKGFKLFSSIDWASIGKSNDKWQCVISAFEQYFKPCQTVMQGWYQLGSLYFNQCKNQLQFMNRLKKIAKEAGFKEQDEIVKLSFVIHNTDPKVRESLIDKADPTKSFNDSHTLARSIESLVQSETMSKQLFLRQRNFE